MRPDRVFAFVAFLLTVTALLLPWWRLTFEDDVGVQRYDFYAFRPEFPATTEWGPWMTGLIAVGAALLLFVRLAADSHVHEPTVWRRDLAIAASLLALAVASCLLWPAAFPSFWGGRTYEGESQDLFGPSTTVTASPGLAWWLALVAMVLTGAAGWKAGRIERRAREEADMAAEAGTTPK